MPNDIQAQADAADQPTVVDPMDVTNSTTSGTNDIDAYRAEVEAALTSFDDEGQGQELAADQEETETQSDDTFSDELEDPSEEAEQDTEDEPDAEPKASGRYRFKDPLDQKIAAVAKAMGVNLLEAAKIVDGQNTTKHEVAAESQEETESSASITAKIKELQAEKRQKNVDLMFEDAANIEEQIDELRDKRDALRISEEREKSLSDAKKRSEYVDTFRKSEEKSVAVYPDAAVQGSALYKEMLRLDAVMLEMEDPLYDDPEKPFILAQKAAKNLRIPMTKPGSEQVKRSTQHRPIQPAGGNARTITTDPARRAAEEIAKIGTADDYERYVASLA